MSQGRSGRRAIDSLHLQALHLYRRLPRLLRRWTVRAVAPKYTVGAIGLVARDDGRVLLVRTAYRSGWGIPGGLLRRRESAEHALCREIEEEVGVRVRPVGAPAVVVAEGPQRVDVVYRARLVREADADSVRPGSPEIVEVGWFASDALPDLQSEAAGALATLARAERR